MVLLPALSLSQNCRFFSDTGTSSRCKTTETKTSLLAPVITSGSSPADADTIRPDPYQVRQPRDRSRRQDRQTRPVYASLLRHVLIGKEPGQRDCSFVFFFRARRGERRLDDKTSDEESR
ncbi:hypothetical protein MRX96_029593 [Rhipicephalus microplus]